MVRSTVLLAARMLGKLHCCMLLLAKYCVLLWAQSRTTPRWSLRISYGELMLELTLTHGGPTHVGPLEQARR